MKKYHRFCSKCLNDYETIYKYSTVCEKCKKVNHKKKVIKNLFKKSHL